MNIKAVIIDDEYLSIEELSFLVSKIPFVDIVGKANCGMDGLKLIHEENPDLVFLDVQMPDITGIDLSRHIQKLKINPKIIFTTAFDKYAIEAFDVDAIDYILKPYDEERVLRAVTKAKEAIEASDSYNSPPNNICLNKLPVLNDEKLILINIDDIVAIYTEDRNIYVKTNKNTFSATYSMQELEDRLIKCGFFRTHRSYLINLNKIKEISPWFNGSYVVMLEGMSTEVPISRNHVKAFKRILGI